MSKNALVAKVATISEICPISALYVNKCILHEERQNNPPAQSILRTAAQIRELNGCLDGEKICEVLNPTNIKSILAVISVSDL